MDKKDVLIEIKLLNRLLRLLFQSKVTYYHRTNEKNRDQPCFGDYISLFVVGNFPVTVNRDVTS